MSKLTVAGMLALSILVELCGVAIGHRIGLSQFASVGVGFVPALLLAYPVVRLLMRRWNSRPLNFAQWVLTISVIAIAATLIHIVIR